ncbi:hypothetical protein L484_018845 [Morus notabilis]|uniref:HVA22-like protein n=2 Tax=Morus notabilis TaxID=981085 RepID=W9RPT5_9ROSA|nr:hypothetical protein L484_018845 [Morus notabilis]
MVFGYAYPAFECYKVVEKNRAENQELRFWCQYWILVAILSVLERIGDAFISWMPMYGELKLALFIYLWYPNTKGSEYVYDAILRPYVIKHEIDIDQKLLAWRERAWDLALFYWKNCTELGQSAFFQVVHYLASQSSRFGHHNGTEREYEHQQQKTSKKQGSSSTGSGSANRAISETTKSKVVQVKLQGHSETEYVHIEDASIMPDNNNNSITQKLSQRLRRFKN